MSLSNSIEKPLSKEGDVICEYELYHYGVKGMKWGIRRFQDRNGRLTKAGKERYSVEPGKKIITNKDGSKTVPAGFKFNRVGKSTMDVNESGGLYVSYGKDDAARYVKQLGPTVIGKMFGTAGEAVQHITVKKNLRMPSDKQVAVETANLLLKNGELLKNFNDSLYAMTVSGELGKAISRKDVEAALKNPTGKEGQKLAYGVSSFLGDNTYAAESRTVYEHFRNKGYDVLPDVHDRLSGTSETAMIVINPEKVKITSTTAITKDVFKAGKAYAKSLGKLPVSELID